MPRDQGHGAYDDSLNGDHRANREGEWYTYTYDGEHLNIIFKKGEGWTGNKNQSEDIKIKQSACFVLTQEGDKKAVPTEVDCE